MLYRLLRLVARVALRWYYRTIVVEGADRVPATGPLLVVANHPNQLVDALLVGTALPRDVTFTGKAILLDAPLTAFVMRRLPFVPLRRAQDERKKLEAAGSEGQSGRGASPAANASQTSGNHRGPPPNTNDGADGAGDRHPGAAPRVDPSRNAEAFRAIHDALAEGQAVLIFPEGISHHRPQLAPVKTGAARIALGARDDRGIRGLSILPVGLNFEDKAAPRSRVLVRIGRPIGIDDWRASGDGGAVEQLTREIDDALRDVTLNFADEAEQRRVLDAARLLSGLFRPPARIDAADVAPDLEYDVARRVGRVRHAAATASPELRARVAAFAARLDALGAELARQDLPVTDIELDTGVAPAAGFLVREGVRALLVAPFALWGRLHHWLPIGAARAIVRRTSRAPEDPAMHTIVVGLGLVTLFYLLLGVVLWRVVGPWWALGWLATLPVCASIDFRFRDLTDRAVRRVRAFFTLRRDPVLRDHLRAEIARLRIEATALESALVGTSVPAGTTTATRQAGSPGPATAHRDRDAGVADPADRADRRGSW